MSKPVPLFRTTNWSSYSGSLKQRGSLMVWFDPELAWFAVPSGKAGHPERYSAAAIQFCLSLKVLFGLRGLARSGEALQCGHRTGCVFGRSG